MTETQRAKELVDAHWDGYVGLLVAMHSGNRTYSHEEMLKLCAWHYKSAGRHFYGHACEDVASGLFRPRIGEVAQYPPAHPYLHKDEIRNCNTCLSNTCKQIGSGKEGCSCWIGAKTAADYTPLSPFEVKDISESVAPAVLCETCVRDKCPPEQRGGIATECAGYMPPPSGEWETKDLCRRCGDNCHFAGHKREVESCECFKPKEAPAPLPLPPARFSYNFPAAERFMGMKPLEYVQKLREEVKEVSEAMTDKDYIIELMDVIHAAETAIRNHAEKHGIDLDDLADHVVAKNRQRGYYQR